MMLAFRDIRQLSFVKSIAKSPSCGGWCSLSSRRTGSTTNSSASSSSSSTTSTSHENLLRAPFKKATHPGRLFPWRHEGKPLERFIPGTRDFHEKGHLLGGNVVSVNAQSDALVTAKFFLSVPWHKMLFFRHWKADLAESMSWAFAQATSCMLSNVYHGEFVTTGSYNQSGFPLIRECH